MTEVHQEKHTSGHLWWKKVYYTYYRYFEGRMIPVEIIPPVTLRQLEKK